MWDDDVLARLGGWDNSPGHIAELVGAASKKYGVPEPLIWAVIKHESAGRIGAESSKKAGGLMQIMPDTAKELGVDNVYNPDENVDKGTQYLAAKIKAAGSVPLGVTHYQAGTDPSKYGPKTAQYAKDVRDSFLANGGDPKLWTMPIGSGALPAVTVRPPSASQGAERATATDGDLDWAKELLQRLTPTPEINPLTMPVPPTAQTVQAPQIPQGYFGTYASDQGVPRPTNGLFDGTPGTRPQWDGWQNYGQGALLGGALPVKAAGAATQEAIQNLQGGMPFSQALARVPNSYTQAKEGYRRDMESWQQANPWTNLGTQLVGSTPTILGTTAMGGGLLAAGGRTVGRALPELAKPIEQAINFVAGKAAGPAEVMDSGGKMLARVGSLATRGAAEGGAAGGLSTGLMPQSVEGNDLLPNVGWGAAIGAGLGPVMGGASGQTFDKLFNAPLEENAAKVAGTKLAGEVGLRGGQVGKSWLLKTVDSILNSGSNGEQISKYNAALAKYMGLKGDRFTNTAVEEAFGVLQRRLDGIARNAVVKYDAPFQARLDAIKNAISVSHSGEEGVHKALTRYIEDLQNGMSGGGLSGLEYATRTEYASTLSQSLRSSGDRRQFAIEIREAIDDALERSLEATKPWLVPELKATRLKYKEMLALKKPVEDAQPTGVIDPKSVKNAVKSSFKDYWRRDPPGDLADFAELGHFLQRPTAQGDAKEPTNLNTIFHWWHAIPLPGVAAAEYLHPGSAVPLSLGLGGATVAARTLAAGLRSNAARNSLVDLANGGNNPLRIPPFYQPMANQMFQGRPANQ